MPVSTELFDLSGKVAIITGSSRGIGRAMAEAFAAHGAKVVLSSRKREACDAVVAAINEALDPDSSGQSSSRELKLPELWEGKAAARMAAVMCSLE